MESFPIPKLRSSWTAALILTLIIFLLYYVFAFNRLLQLYRSQFDSIFFGQNQSQLKVLAFIPRYYNSSESAWAYINVQNNSNDPIYDLEVYLIANSDESTLLLPNLYNENVYSSGSTLTVIEPHSIATARIPFITQGDAIINKVILIQKNDKTRKELERQSPTEYIQPNKSPLRALQHSFLETILLPPWSNTFILALVVFSAYLVRNRKEEELNNEEPDEPKTLTPAWWIWVWNDIKNSANVINWMIYLTILFVLTNYSTLSPIFCIIALQLMWWMETKFWKKDILKKFRRPLFLSALSLGFLGLIHAGLGLLFTALVLLFPTLAPSWLMSSNDRWVWGLALLASGLVLKRNWKSSNVLEEYIKQFYFWGFSFLILAIIYIVMFYFNEKKPVDAIFSWWLLIIGSIGIIFWHYNKERRLNPSSTIPSKSQRKKK